MQANCPKCSNRIAIDDAKVPDRAFNVKCPKCQAVVRFPGKAAAPAAPPAAASAAAAPPASEESFEPPPLPPAGAREEGEAGHALVVLTDRNLTGAMTVALTRAGYNVQSPETPAEGAALLDQGFDVVVTTRTAGEGQDNIYQRIGRLTPEARRGVFLLLVGDEFRTGDGTQAWAVLADLVMKPTDVAAGAERYLRAVAGERRRVYQAFNEAWQKVEADKA